MKSLEKHFKYDSHNILKPIKQSKKKPKKKRFCYDFQRKYQKMREKRQLKKINDLTRTDKRLDKRDSHYADEYSEKVKRRLQVLSCASKFPLVSPMGRRIYRSLHNSIADLSEHDMLATIKRYERCSSTRISFSARSAPTFGSWKCAAIEKNCFKLDVTTVFNPNSDYCHRYSFNRCQRLERNKRIDTRLDWKSRLKARQCRPLFVKLAKCQACPLCGHALRVGHYCGDFAATADTTRDPNHRQYSDCDNSSLHSNSNITEMSTLNTDRYNQLKALALENINKVFVRLEKLDLKKALSDSKCLIALDELCDEEDEEVDEEVEEKRVCDINLDTSE